MKAEMVADQQVLDAEKYEDDSFPASKLKVFNVQRTCVHDGPGIRTTIFFQGCNLRCIWCQNPEALSFSSGLAPDGDYTVSDIMDVVYRDKEYYYKTGGGVTLSGGEPFLQDPESLIIILKKLKKEKIHIAVETSMHAPWKNIEKILPYIDLFIVDLKVVGDEALHKELTKHDSRLIRQNIGKLVNTDADIIFRMVVVPGYNDSKKQIKATAEYLKSLGYQTIELLKYHNLYENKAKRLGLVTDTLNITPQESLSALKKAVALFESHYSFEVKCDDLDAARNKAVFTERVYKIQNDIRESDYHLCLESSNIKTDYYKENGFDKPTHIHRAERLVYLLKNKQKNIYPGELLVGNFTSKRVGGQLWEEHYGILFALIIHQIENQTPVPFKCSPEDKRSFYTKILPFWSDRSILTRFNPSLADMIMMIARSSEMNVGFNNNLAAIAHFIVNFERILQMGTTGIIKEVEKMQKENPENNHDFYRAVIIALKGLETFAEHYAEKLLSLSIEEQDPERRRELAEMTEICKYVPKNPARSYHEALQAMLFIHIAICLESYENAISLGRLDQILYPYYEKDLKAGIIDYENAKELLALFILKMDEAILVHDGDTYLGIGKLFETLSTDQTVTFGGLGKNGKDATNEITCMLLDICELQPRAVNMTARIHENSPREYLDRISEVYINGSPMPALCNDKLYIETLQKHYNVGLSDARNYAIVGCVEPNASDDHYGNTDCANMNVVLPFLQALRGEEEDLYNYSPLDQAEKITTKFVDYFFNGNGKVPEFIRSNYKKALGFYQNRKEAVPNPPGSMDELLDRFQLRLNHLAAGVLNDHQKIESVIREHFTTPLASSLSRGCIKNGKDLNEGGATHNSSGIQAVGVTDVADSLHAINELVYKKKHYSINEIISAIESDFEGDHNQKIRKALSSVPKFGHDSSQEAIDWENKVLEIFVNALNSVSNSPRNGIYTAGYYALNVNDVYGKKTPSLPSGRLKGVPLANSITPHYGMESNDLLSSLNSVAGIDYVNYAPNGTTVTFTIDSALFNGPEGVKNLSGLITTYFKKGGMQFQPNVINREILLEAYNDPQKHPYLLVRIAGYCAYFNELSDDLKLIIINRTCYS